MDIIPGGKLFNNQTIVDYGLELIDGCWNTYASTAYVPVFPILIQQTIFNFDPSFSMISTGIGPEAFAYISSDGNYTGFPDPSTDDLAFYSKHGFYILYSDYILRPEVLESNFYAWRVTGDTKYLDRAASAVESFNRYLTANVGYAGIEDVNDVASAKIDDMESFWFAEVLKYLWVSELFLKFKFLPYIKILTRCIVVGISRSMILITSALTIVGVNSSSLSQSAY